MTFLRQTEHGYLGGPGYGAYQRLCILAEVVNRTLVRWSAAQLSNMSGGSMSNTRHALNLPHHGMYHLRKRDKLRVVFDDSSKYQSVSFKDRFLSGP